MDYATFAQRLGSNIRKARWLRGWTQGEVAAQGISFRYFQEVERGQRNPSAQMLFDIAQILGVTVADLTNVPGARPAEIPLSARKAVAPPRGRKPKKKTPRR